MITTRQPLDNALLRAIAVYRARVHASASVETDRLASVGSWQGMIVQRTPKRVSHRRADLERERRVSVLELQGVGSSHLDLRVRCDHGTYVKEWISGDGQRTQPSLGSLLGVDCACETLDVEEVLADE